MHKELYNADVHTYISNFAYVGTLAVPVPSLDKGGGLIIFVMAMPLN